MSDDEDELPDRPSVMEYNGGLITGPPARLDPQDEQLARFDRGAEYHRLTAGGKQFRGHPTFQCPAPRYMSTFRGFYHCPGCGKKVRLDGDPGMLEAAREDADWALATIGWALGECWYILWESVKAIARGVRMVCLAGVDRRRQAADDGCECERCLQAEDAEVAEADATMVLTVKDGPDDPASIRAQARDVLYGRP